MKTTLLLGSVILGLAWLGTPLFAETGRNCVVILSDLRPMVDVAIERLREKLPGTWDVINGPATPAAARFDRMVYVGRAADFVGNTEVDLPRLGNDEAYAIKTKGTSVYIAGGGPRGVLYGVYEFVEEALFQTGPTVLNVQRQPLIPQRYAWATPHTFGGTMPRPMLFWQKTLKELPKLGINGIFLIAYYQYPAESGPVPWEDRGGKFVVSESQLAEYRLFISELKRRGLDVCLAIAPVVPADYPDWQIKLHMVGLQHFGHLEERMRKYFRSYLEEIQKNLPEVDSIILSSNEGLRQGINLFVIDNQAFRNSQRKPEVSERVLDGYLGELDDFCKKYGKTGGFWTHNAGATWEDFRAMHRALAKHPDMIALENPWFPDLGWRVLDFLSFLPPDVRDHVHEQSKLGVIYTMSDAGTYDGAGRLPTSIPEPFLKATAAMMARKPQMTVLRIDDWDFTALGTLFNIDAIIPQVVSNGSWSAPMDPEKAWLRLTANRFGRKAAPKVLAALKLAQPIQLQGFTICGLSALTYSTLGAGNWTPPKVLSNADFGPTVESVTSTFLAFRKPGTPFVASQMGEFPGPQDFIAFQYGSKAAPIGEFRRNQAIASAACEQGVALIEEAKPDLAPADYDYLHRTYVDAPLMLEGTRLLGEAAYATNLMADNFDHVPDPRKNFESALGQLEDFGERVRPLGRLWNAPEAGPPIIGPSRRDIPPTLSETVATVIRQFREYAKTPAP